MTQYQVIDLTQSTFQKIYKALKTETDIGNLLHGSNSTALFKKLEARQADDTARESGRKKAVYAADAPEEALHRAVVNMEFLRKLHSFTIGWTFKNGKMIMKADPNVFRLLKDQYKKCFSDGYVYVLDRKDFHQSEDASREFAAQSDQTPLKVYKVPGLTVASTMFVIGDTIIPYNEKEMQKINAHIAKKIVK